MRRKTLINNIIVFVIVMGLVFVVALINNSSHGTANLLNVILFYLLGAIIWGVINAFVHEFGHVIFAKKNGFKVMSFSVWFFKWTRTKKGFRFDFTGLGEESGSTETVPITPENMAKRYKKVSLGGIIASGILTVLSVVPLFFGVKIDYRFFCVLSISLPISVYYFLGNLLPMVNDGFKNDGAVYFGLKKEDDSSKVMCSVLSIQSELYNGKTPSEIDEKYYFDLPQLPEDDFNFIMLLNARYSYYLDKKDYENAKKVTARLIGLCDDLPKSVALRIKADALYNACTFDFNEEVADELMYETEKLLNSSTDVSYIRIKLAYILYVDKKTDVVESFYKKGIKEANKCQIKGLGLFEKKLLDDMKQDFNK